MNITISGHHLEVTQAIREHITTKLDRIMRHYDQVIDIAVTLTVDKLKEKEKRHKADINMHVPGRDIHVESMAQDLYAAIDLLMDKLDRQVIRHKDKLQAHSCDAVKHLPAENDASGTDADDADFGSLASA